MATDSAILTPEGQRQDEAAGRWELLRRLLVSLGRRLPRYSGKFLFTHSLRLLGGNPVGRHNSYIIKDDIFDARICSLGVDMHPLGVASKDIQSYYYI